MNELTKSRQNPAQEWSHYVFSEDVDEKSMRISITAPKDSMAALCKRLDLCSIENLSADVILVRNHVSKVINIKGTLMADVHQYCVVTMEPVATHVQDDFESWYAEPNNAVSFAKAKRERMSPQERSEQPMLEEYDDPEEIIDGKIDLGELIVQHFSLSLTQYPRKEGAVFENGDRQLDNDDGMYDNPFAALKDWKASEKKKD